MIHLPGRRVIGKHSVRLQGLSDLFLHAPGASVLDVGCNRGVQLYDMYLHGARLLHGIDLAPDAIENARALFADEVGAQCQFEVGDLTRGAAALAPFGDGGYDIVMMIATYHKLARAPSKPYQELGAKGMTAQELSDFMRHLGSRTQKFFAFKAPNMDAFGQVDRDLSDAGLKRIATSAICSIGPAGIWRRGD